MHILHVTECYDGGVSRAIDTLASTAEHESHSLLAYGSEEIPDGLYAGTYDLGTGTLSRVRRYREVLRKVRPDVVHAHSSWAGLYTRLLPQDTPVIYQPHCFVFDDPERKRWERGLYYFAEKVLSGRSSVAVALSKHEEKLARGLSGSWRVLHLPNTASISLDAAPVSLAMTGRIPISAEAAVPTVAMVGRVCPQKSPQFFAEVANIAAGAGRNWHFKWVGDGDPDLKGLLKAAGVEITGWLGRDDLVQTLTDATLYFHSASYEGFPLSVLDAAHCGLPIIAREIPCFEETPILTVKTPRDAFEELYRALTDDRRMLELRDISVALDETMSSDAQERAIRKIYQAATAG